MRRAFQSLQYLLYVVVGQARRQPHLAWSHRERLARWTPRGVHRESEAQKAVDCLLERSSRAASFLLQEPGNVFIEG